MKILILSICICLYSLTLISQTDNIKTEFNFGFEITSSTGNLPNKWFRWGNGYNIKIDSLEKHSGKNSVSIEPFAERLKNSFGCVAYSIPANYEGNVIEVKVYMKIKNVADGPIGLLLRIDGESGTLKFDNMQSKNITGTSDWTQYSVKLPYPNDAKIIYIGALLSGTGQIWVDDFQLLIDGKDINEVKLKEREKYKADLDKEFDNGSKISSIILTDSKINDLDVLGKVWGLLKYHHPMIAKGEYNWDYELFRILPKILESKNQSERNDILFSWVRSIGNITKGNNIDKNNKIKLNPDYTWFDNSVLGKNLTSQLNDIKNAERTGINYYIGLFPGVGNPEFKHENPYLEMKYSDAGYRLLSLYRYWNIIQYFFPYKNLIEENWGDVLKRFIPKFINASNELEYKLAALALIESVHDSHAGIWGKDSILNVYRGVNSAPVQIKFVENKPVIIDTYDSTWFEQSGLKIGDEIITINNRSVEEIIKEKLPFTTASNHPTKLRNLAQNLLRTNDSELMVGYKRSTSKSNIQIQCLPIDKSKFVPVFHKKDTCFKLLPSNIAYLYPGSIKKGSFPKIIPEIMKTKGLIIDFRCYPSDFIVFTLSEYLLPKKTSFVKFSKGSIITPGLFILTDDLKVGRENKDYFKGKVIILIDETTQSSAEYHTMVFRAAPKALVVGSTTAGADGNVSSFYLPGGIYTRISGIGVYYPDGKETQRIGIIPDIEMKPTIKGIAEGRDELLEKAIEIINGK